jgi:hypothetical protein
LRSTLLRLAELALRRPGTVALVTALPCVALGIYGAFVPVDLTFTGIMDRDEPLVAAYYELSDELVFAGRLPLLLEGDEERLDEAARALVPVLEALDSVDTVIAEPPDAWLRDHAPFFVDREVFDAWLALATRPQDGESAKRLAERLGEMERELAATRPNGARLVLIRMSIDPMMLPAGGGPFLEIDERTQEVLARHGVSGRYAGLPAIAAQDQSRTLFKVQVLSPLSLLLVLLIFRFVERRKVRLVAVAAPMLLTVGATLGVVGALTDQLTVMETFFGVMVFGLGIDFALHLMVRLREERARGLDFEAAVRETWTGAGTGVVAGGLTTTGAFGIVALAPDPLALHLGLSGAVGLFCCLLLMLTLLPAAWTMLERQGGRRGSGTGRPRALEVRWIGVLTRHAVAHPWLHVAAGVTVLVVAVSGVPRFTYETDLKRVFNRQVPALAAMERIQEIFGVNPGPWVVLAKDLEEARAVERGFAKEPLFHRVESAARFFPADLDERTRALAGARGEIDTQRKVYAGLLPLMSDEEQTQMKGAIELLDALERARAVGPPRLDALPPALAAELLGPDGKLVVFAYAKEPTIDGRIAAKERRAAQRVHEDAVGFGNLLEATMAAERPWAVPVFFGILAFVFVLLMIDMRSPKLVLITLVPVVFGAAVTLGVLCWVGLRFNVLTTFIIPLIIGLGVDDGIHVMHRVREPGDQDLVERTSSVGGAILMTTVTTCASFSTLLFTDHAGLEGIAIVLILGLPLCLLASITLVPAMCVLGGVAERPKKQ